MRDVKQEFIRFLVFAHSSCDETINHGDIPDPESRIAHLAS